MKIYLNHERPLFNRSGGAHSFLSALRQSLDKKGIKVTSNLKRPVDLYLINALTGGVNIDSVAKIADSGKKIVHRKVGYAVSGSPEMRAVVDGVVAGDAVQMAFDKFVSKTIFQSNYSKEAFIAQGFYGESEMIWNGVDQSMFFPSTKSDFSLPKESNKLKIVACSWSTDPNKGFSDYEAIDALLTKFPSVEMYFVGRLPADLKFRNIISLGTKRKRNIAKILRSCDGYIHMARKETCSNALLEALSCGLPVLYNNSGSSEELIQKAGVPVKNIESSFVKFLDTHKLLRLNALDQVEKFDIVRVTEKYINTMYE